MTVHSYSAARNTGQSHTVTRSTDDGLAGGTLAHFSFDDATVLDNTQLRELWRDVVDRVNTDWRGVSAPTDLGSGVEQAFADGGKFDDDALFSDQGAGGNLTYQVSVSNDNAHTVSRGTSNAIGSAAAVLILAGGILTKPAARAAIEAVRRALNRDGLAFSDPADYPVSGSVGV